MPLVRFKIRNELSLGGPELNRSPAVEYEEPKAILGAVEVAGLVGILRQLGDLAEFSAEVFNGIQEEVTVTATRCQKLTSRVKRIESALSPLEKAVLSQTSHIHFAYTAGCEWHPRIRNGQRHFVQSDLPLCVMETYEQCRDPPPLHLLDRFDAGGPGSCLRKYSDPTFFRKELGNPSKANDIKVQRDQHRKRKKKRLLQRNICRSRAVSTSDETIGAHISYLSDDRPTTSQSTSTVDMPRSSNMQELSDMVDQSHLPEQSDSQEPSEAQIQSGFQESSKPRDSITGSGYIEYVINKSPVNKPEANLVERFLSGSLQPADRIGSSVPEGCVEVLDDNILYSPSDDMHVPCASIVCDEKKETLELSDEKSNEEASEIHELKFGPGTPDRVTQNQRDFDRTYNFFDVVDTMEGIQSRSQANSIDRKPRVENEVENKSEQGSEADEFVDARNTVESESESELDGAPKPKLEHYFGDISTYCSEDANSDNNDGSDLPYEEMLEDPRHDNSLDESCSGSYLTDDTNVPRCLSDPVCDETFQKPREFFATCPSLLAEEAFLDVTVLPEEPVAAHPLLAGICANGKISSKEPISPGPSMKDDIPTGKILPEEHLANYPSLAETVSHEKIMIGEPVAKYPSFAEVVPTKTILPEKSIPKIPSLAEAVPDNVTPAEKPDAAHPSFSKAVQENKILPEVLDSEICSVPEAVSQEQISPKEYVGIYPRLAEALPDERFLTVESEEPATTCLSLTKGMPTEKLLPELEAYDYLAESPKEKILQEKSVDSTHPSCAKGVPEEKLSSKVLDSTNFSVAEVVSQEHIGLEEFVGIDPCFAEAVPDERFLPGEPVITCLSLTKSATIEGVLPEKPLETYPSFAKLPEQEILHEEADDATHPSLSEAVSDEQISPDVLDSTYFPVAAVFPQEQILLEESVGSPCLAEVVPDKRGFPEEPVTTCMSLTKPEDIHEVWPEERLESTSSENSPKDKISQEKSDDGTHPSCAKAESDENVSPVLDSENLTVAEAIPQEIIGIYPCFAEGVTDERVLPKEHVTTFIMSMTKDVPIETILPEEPLEVYPSLGEFPEEKISQDDDTHPYFSEAVGAEKISPVEHPCCTYPSLEESVLHEKTAHEELFGTNPFLDLAVPNESSVPDKSGVTYQSSAEAVSKENNLPDTHPYLAEAVPEEKISLEEPDATCLPSAETVFDEKISGSEPGYTTESAPHNDTFHQEPVATDLSLTEATLTFDEHIPGLESPASTTETGPHNKTFPEEPVPDENILPKEPAYLDLSEGIPDQKVFLDDAAFLSFAEAIFDQKFSPDVPDSTYPFLTEPEMPAASPSLVTDLPAKNILIKEGEAYDDPYTASADRTFPSSGGTVTISPDSLSNGTTVESVNIWSNGGLLGLAPSKPPVFAEPNSVSEHIQNEINEAGVLGTRKQESSSRSVQATEKSSLPLVVSIPTSQQQSSMLSHSNGSLSHLQSTATSFKVFGLSHRLLMAGFRGNSKFGSIPTTSYDTKTAAIEDKTQHTPRGSSCEEKLTCESSLFGSPTSSPPVEHMKISFNPIDASPVSKLKLRIPCQPQKSGENADMFPSFQLVPEASNSDDDDNSDIFCQSSPCSISDNCLSDSELWESDESPRESTSSLKRVGERSTHGDMGSFSGSFLDLPCFDSVDHQSTFSRLEQEHVSEYKLPVSEIIRDWPPNQPKSRPSNEANANVVLDEHKRKWI